MESTIIDRDPLMFSIIIPAYNSANTICRAISSVMAQTYKNFEVIIVDDASTDNTISLVQREFGGQVIVIQKVVNSGSSVARNAGMDKALGQYIAFLDADDAWHADKLLLIHIILSSNPGIRLLYHPYSLTPVEQHPIPETITLYRLPFVKLLPANMIATSCAVILNNTAFRFDPNMRYTEDYDLWLRMGYKYRIYFITIPLTRIYRPFTTTGGISARRWKMRRGEMRAYRKLTSLHPLFLFLLPFLWAGSIIKYLWKAMVGAR